MPNHTVTEPITIRIAKISEIDALASAMDRSRNYVVNQAIEQYLDANAWGVERIMAGIEVAQSGNVQPAGEVFAKIAAKHGWAR